MLGNQLKEVNDVLGLVVRRLSSEIIANGQGYTGFGIKADVDLILFGFKLPQVGVEIVYNVSKLARCGKYKNAYRVLDGQRSMRIFVYIKADLKLGKFLKVKSAKGLGIGGEIAYGLETDDIIFRLTAWFSIFKIPMQVDVFIDKLGFSAVYEANVFGIFRAQIAVQATVFVPVEQLRFRADVLLVPGPDDSFHGSLLDALRRFAKELAESAIKRITDAQDAITDAQDWLTDAEDWLESKKTDLDTANEDFDAAILKLEEAKQSVEDAKAPFYEALESLRQAQRDIDNLCQIRDCMICVPGFKCKWCYTSGWIRFPYPCCWGTDCMFRIPDPFCLIQNLACYIIRGLAYFALEVAKFFVKGAMVVMDLAKQALALAQFIVDKSRWVIDVAKFALDIAKVGVQFAKMVLEGAKIALEAVKYIVRAAFEVFNFIVKYGLQSLFDVKKCGFGVEISVKDVFIIDVHCEINFFRLGWRIFQFRLDFTNIFLTLWEAAKSIVTVLFETLGDLLAAIFSGRRKRELTFTLNSHLHVLHRMIRSVNISQNVWNSTFNESVDVTDKIAGFRNSTSKNMSESDNYIV